MKKLYRKSITKSWLNKNHFKYSSFLSEKDSDCYTLRFPVYRWQVITTIEAEIKVFLQQNIIKLDLYDGQTRDIYAPYYYQEFGNYDSIMNKINDAINEKLTKIGIDWKDE